MYHKYFVSFLYTLNLHINFNFDQSKIKLVNYFSCFKFIFMYRFITLILQHKIIIKLQAYTT